MDDLKLLKRAESYDKRYHKNYEAVEKLYSLLGYVQGVYETSESFEVAVIESKIKKIINVLE